MNAVRDSAYAWQKSGDKSLRKAIKHRMPPYDQRFTAGSASSLGTFGPLGNLWTHDLAGNQTICSAAEEGSIEWVLYVMLPAVDFDPTLLLPSHSSAAYFDFLKGHSKQAESGGRFLNFVVRESVEGNVTETLVEEAERLVRQGKINAATDLIYARVDRMMRQNRLSELDAILAGVRADQTSLETLISLLTVTLPVRKRLRSRHAFFDSVEQVARRGNRWDETLLLGLGN